jgi:aspartyl protease family protein
MDGDTIARMAYLGLLLAAVGGWVIVEYRQRLGLALRAAAAWGLIFVGAVAGYGLWSDIRTDIGPAQMTVSEGKVELPRAPDGHYYATLMLNGTELRFMADTGATNMVLSQQDARRIGIDPATLVYLAEAQTANGTVRTARVTLDSVELGPFRDAPFQAWVTDGEMEGSLLGMDYLGLFRIEITGDRMILTR